MSRSTEHRTNAMGRMALALLASALVAASGPTVALAADSGELLPPAKNAWPTFRGNEQMTGVSPSKLRQDLEVKWAFETDSEIESTAAIVDGRVYFGAYDGYLYCLKLSNGKLLWKYNAENAIKASPSVYDGVVYVGDEYGFFHAVDAKSGEKLWSFETMAEILSSAAFYEDQVLFGSYDNSLYSLDRKTGKKLWHVETDGYVHGTPAIRDGITTVSGCDGYMWIIDVAAGGKVLEKIDLGGQAAASAALLGDYAYVGTFENQVIGVDLEKRRVAWVYEHERRKFPFYASAAVREDVVVIGGRDKLIHALDPKTGEQLWEWNSGARLDSSPVIVGDRLFVGSKNGVVGALDLADGALGWTYDTGSAIVASPAVASEKLVIGTLDGTLLCFE